jgi:hypothetical protein
LTEDGPLRPVGFGADRKPLWRKSLKLRQELTSKSPNEFRPQKPIYHGKVRWQDRWRKPLKLRQELTPESRNWLESLQIFRSEFRPQSAAAVSPPHCAPDFSSPFVIENPRTPRSPDAPWAEYLKFSCLMRRKFLRNGSKKMAQVI